mmetsp:Transcript_106259/g.317515  ORF Transcript_106259/g.317515 Transcript_106259/m.317515 type:complete len:293 (+) Transcript_106259:382-1260(+)
MGVQLEDGGLGRDKQALVVVLVGVHPAADEVALLIVAIGRKQLKGLRVTLSQCLRAGKAVGERVDAVALHVVDNQHQGGDAMTRDGLISMLIEPHVLVVGDGRSTVLLYDLPVCLLAGRVLLQPPHAGLGKLKEHRRVLRIGHFVDDHDPVAHELLEEGEIPLGLGHIGPRDARELLVVRAVGPQVHHLVRWREGAGHAAVGLDPRDVIGGGRSCWGGKRLGHFVGVGTEEVRREEALVRAVAPLHAEVAVVFGLDGLGGKVGRTAGAQRRAGEDLLARRGTHVEGVPAGIT